MAVKAVARQSSVRHTGALHEPQSLEEDNHVLPHPCRRMDHHHPHIFADVEQAPGDGIGPVEPGHGAGALLCADRGQRMAGGDAPAQGEYRPTAAARVVLRSHSQAGRPAPSPRRGGLLCALAALGAAPLAGHAGGPGPRRHHLGHPLHGVGHQRRVSRLCHPGGLDDLAGQPARGLRCHWLRMLRQLRPAIPRRWTVIVLADRGLYAPWLFRRLVRLGWHPFLRVNTGGTFRPDPRATYRPLASFVPHPGTRWRGTGTAFKSPQRRLRCTLLAAWEEGYTDPWLILTDLPPEASAAGWYGLRAWIEQQFKCIKRAGWQWQRTRMTQPARAARLWLAVAVATLWLLSVGGVAEEAIPESTLLEVSDALAGQRHQRRATRLRLVSIFRRGWITILVALLQQAPLPLGAFLPEPWPRVPALEASSGVPNPEVYQHVAA